MAGVALVDRVIETGRVPDSVLRAGIRAVCSSRLRRERRRPPGFREAFVRRLRESPIAEHVEKANEQHYEVPAEFFRLVLGPRLKYSACLWPDGIETLARAEEAPSRLHELARERQAARDSRDFDAADRLRAKIEAEGWVVRDVSDEPGYQLVPR